MVGRSVRAVTALATVALAVVGTLVAGPAGASPGEGTYTRITTPARDLLFHLTLPGSNNLRVRGVTSSDVTQVDMDCVFGSSAKRVVEPLQTAVPVTSGAFSALVSVADVLEPCRLRAVPTGVNAEQDYLGSFSGPVLRVAGVQLEKATGGETIGYQAVTAAGTGLALMRDASDCEESTLVTIETPAMEIRGSGLREACALTLPAENSSNTASSIKVDGHDAYLPFGVANFLVQQHHLAVPQSTLSVSSHFAPNGDLHLVESGKLRRCTGVAPDTYPPTATSCSGLADTGVTLHRVVDVFRGAHQIRLRDSLLGADGHAHSVHLQYFSGFSPLPTGTTGYLVPNHGSAFRKVSIGQVFTGVGTRTNTLYLRSDLYAASDDPDADTFGYTWSRGPQRVQINPDSTPVFELPYALHVAAHGRVDLGFAWTERLLTKDTRALALVAQREMVNPPHVSSPHNRAVIKGRSTTVKGYVTLGANGVPTRVTVNGHAARLHRVSPTKSTYAVTFSESLRRHVLHVTATDVAGNTRTVRLHVRNR